MIIKMMSMLHILNTHRNPFPHLKGQGGLHYHPSRNMIGGRSIMKPSERVPYIDAHIIGGMIKAEEPEESIESILAEQPVYDLSKVEYDKIPIPNDEDDIDEDELDELIPLNIPEKTLQEYIKENNVKGQLTKAEKYDVLKDENIRRKKIAIDLMKKKYYGKPVVAVKAVKAVKAKSETNPRDDVYKSKGKLKDIDEVNREALRNELIRLNQSRSGDKQKLYDKLKTFLETKPKEKSIEKVKSKEEIEVSKQSFDKLFDELIDKLLTQKITKYTLDTIKSMHNTFEIVNTTVKGHGKSLENMFCKTDFQYILKSLSNSDIPIINNDTSKKLLGHFGKYKRNGKNVPLEENCVYDLFNGKASFEIKNYFGTKTWGGESFYNNTDGGLTMTKSKFEGNFNFIPYFNQVNGEWKLYNVLVEYSHTKPEPTYKWLYKQFDTDVFFVVLCNDALVYYDFTKDFDNYVYYVSSDTKTKNGDDLYKVDYNESIKIGMLSHKDSENAYIPISKFKPIIPI
jgi:hypothetical protein